MSETANEEALRSSEAMFQGLFEHSPDAVVVVDSEGRIGRVNTQLERLFGFDREELVGQPIEALLPERFHERHIVHRTGYLAAPRARPMGAELELYGRRKDGSEFPVDIMLSPLQLTGSSLTLGVIRDITERKQVEEALRASQAMFEGLFEHSPDGIVVVNAAGEIENVNVQLEHLFGYDRRELLGQPIECLLPERLRERHVGHRDTYSRQTRTRPMGAGLELYARRKDGSEFPVDIMLSPLGSGESVRVLAVVRDVTGRKKAEDQLREYASRLERSNRELQDFAMVASHDLQEPLRKIQAFGDLLRSECGPALSSDGQEYLEFMQDAARRMQSLIQALLTLSRVTTRGQPFVQVELGRLANEALSDLQMRLEQTGARVEVEEIPVIEADPTQIRQLFQNLIGNALKFHRPEEPPLIRVGGHLLEGRQTAAPEPPLCQITVQDNGIGFDEKYLDRIFAPFQRLHGQGQYEGTGMGLAICRKIVERHGGSITARSTPGEGSTFTLTLPVHQRRDSP